MDKILKLIIKKAGILALATVVIPGIFMMGIPPKVNAADKPSPKDMEIVQDYYEAFKDTSGETAEKLKKMREHYLSMKKQYGQDPKFKDVFDRLDQANFSGKLRESYNGLGKFNDMAENIKKAQDFYDRYKPDQNDPTRSLTQISNLIEDFQKMLPLPEDIKKPMTQLLTFYAQACTSYAEALKKLEKKMDDYRQGSIGVGGRSDIGASDQIKKYSSQGFSDPIQRTGEILLFPPAEVWVSNTSEGNAFIWDGEKWTKFDVGVGFLQELYTYYREGMGQPIPTDRLIQQARNYQSIKQRIEEARALYSALHKISEGGSRDQYYLLQAAGKLDELEALMKETGGMEAFIGMYINSAGKRESMNSIMGYLESHVGVSGTVMYEKNDEIRGLSGATVSAEKASTVSGGNGDYTLILAQKPGTSAVVTAKHEKFPSAGQCEVYFETQFQSGCDIVMGKKSSEDDLTGPLTQATLQLSNLDDLYNSFMKYYNYYMRMVEHGSAITSPSGGGVGEGGSFGNQMGRVLAYPFVQAEKKMNLLLQKQSELNLLETNLKQYDSKSSEPLRQALEKLETLKESVFGPSGVSNKFRQMRESLWQFGFTEEHLHMHADAIPDGLDPSFATNMIGTDGEIPASR